MTAACCLGISQVRALAAHGTSGIRAIALRKTVDTISNNAGGTIPSGISILVADNDADALQMLVPALQSAGYSTLTAVSGLDSLRSLFSHHPDLVILSLSLPGMDAWTVLQRMREVTDIPVLIVSTSHSVGLRLRAFELHAQDFIAKPFHLDEFVLRVKAALQRSSHLPNGTRPVYDDGILLIDGNKRDVSVDGKPLSVTDRELDLLVSLAHQPGRLQSYADLMESLPWLANENGATVLRSAVYRLRRKLALAGCGHSYIETQRDLGIRLNIG